MSKSDTDSDCDFEQVKVGQKIGEASVNTFVASSASGSVEDVLPEIIPTNCPRRTYLLTYSKANKDLFPTRESFASKCMEAFGGSKVVSCLACAEEAHQDGSRHYHVSVKLNRSQR